MEAEQTSRFGIALAISVGAHLLFAVMAEVGSSGSPSKKVLQSPPVEISRVAMDGTTLPTGPGKGTINSPSSAASQPFGQRYQLDAGVPMKLDPPAPQPKTSPLPDQKPNPAPTTQTPISTPPQSQPQTPPTQRNPNEFPVYQGSPNGQQAPASQPSQPNTAGNQGQKRSRGPNRLAFPEYTVEPNVAQSMIGGGVTNSVDVSVSIAADGSHTEQIVRSSGSADVDALVLDALKQWRWDPAAREGQAIASTQNFKFTFKPR